MRIIGKYGSLSDGKSSKIFIWCLGTALNLLLRLLQKGEKQPVSKKINFTFSTRLHDYLSARLFLVLSLLLTCSLLDTKASIGPFGGTVFHLATDPTNPNLIYATTNHNGIFKSTDRGEHWTEASAGLPYLYIRALAIAPSDSKILYAGLYPVGLSLFKSTDQGESWVAINAPPQAYYLWTLAIDPFDPNTIYAGGMHRSQVAAAVFKSTDGGGHWFYRRLSYNQSVWTLAVDPAQRNTVYAGTANGVFKSTDRGDNWLRVGIPRGGALHSLLISTQNTSTVYADFFKSTDGGGHWTRMGLTEDLTSLTLYQNNPDILYASTTRGVFRSTDSGETWSNISEEAAAGGANSVAVAPDDSNTIYSAAHTGVFKTVDAGGHWSDANMGLTNRIIRSVIVDSNNSNVIYVAMDSDRIFKSTDRGRSWSPSNAGLTAPSAWALALDPSDSNTLYAGTGVGVFKSNDGAANWFQTGFNNPNVFALVIDPNDPNIVYAAGGAGVYKSIDRGEHWFRTEQPNAVSSIIVDLEDSTTLYAGASYPRPGIYKTINGGENWFHTGNLKQPVRSLAIDPNHSNTIYAGYAPTCCPPQKATVHMTRDGGRRWREIPRGLPNVSINALAIDLRNSHIIYAGTDRGIYKSINSGRRWFEAGMELAIKVVLSLAIDPNDPNIIYAGTSGAAVFVTYNGGESWD